MRIDANGNVGIGTTTPGAWFSGRTLELSDVRPILKLTSTAATGLSTITFTNSNVNSGSHVGEFHLNYQFDQTNNDKSLLRFSGYPVGDIIALQANGNIGIGTTAPEQKLDVRGNIGMETGTDPYLYTGTGPTELNRYLELLNSAQHQSASGLKVAVF